MANNNKGQKGQNGFDVEAAVAANIVATNEEVAAAQAVVAKRDAEARQRKLTGELIWAKKELNKYVAALQDIRKKEAAAKANLQRVGNGLAAFEATGNFEAFVKALYEMTEIDGYTLRNAEAYASQHEISVS